MKEIRNIVRAFHEANRAGKRTALATVVHVEGSAYRRPGARMLVTEDGQLTGAISGGCLEGDALRKALLTIGQGKNKLVTYDTTEEDNAHVGVQLGCNGIIHILFEPILPEAPDHPMRLLEYILGERRTAALTTLFSFERANGQHPGTCFLNLGEAIFHSPLVEPLKRNLWNDAREALATETSLTRYYVLEDQLLTGFVECIKPPVSLVIVGGGNDAIPLAEMAHTIGWEITIVDGRSNYANRQRFPMAGRVIVAKPDQVVTQLQIDKHAAVLLMTHNYNYDLAVLKQLIWSNCNYIGSLGPKKKMERMLDDLKQEGIAQGTLQQAKIFGPVGLDMGAETPEEIALSILAEIKIVFSKKDGASLRERKSPIHASPF